MSKWSAETYKASDLAELIDKKEIRVPPYQRGQVWKKKQEEKLVDSIKKGFPFGTLLLYKKGNGNFQLIDGLQRSTTITKYLKNPAKFYKDEDIDENTIDKIYKLLSISGNKEKIKASIKSIIKDWVINNHRTMEDVKNMDYPECAKILIESYPTGKDNMWEIITIIGKMFKKFKEECEEFSNTEIPAIIYYGDPGNLPTIFDRINSQGTQLSKYQILAATWTYQKYKILNEDLKGIVDYVNKFYTSLLDENFEIDEYNVNSLYMEKDLNLYQLLFGFGKLLADKYPYLFSLVKKDKDVQSCGFNLVNACVGNRNSKIEDLSKILNECFHTDQEINDFLCNILRVTDEAYKCLQSYLKFKLNKRDDTIVIYHTEMQICSLISNIFKAKYTYYTYDDHQNIIGRSIEIHKSKKSYDDYKHKLRENCFKRYLIDILNNKWKGTGDKNLDEISLNPSYYTDYISRDMLENTLDHWIGQMNTERNEYRKVKMPGPGEKLLLSVIYSKTFTAYEQNDDINYDIEHLAPKGALKKILKLFNLNGVYSGLPISSFANLCLLREEENRKKKDKTLYEDDNYLKIINNKYVSLEEIENKFSFTKEEDFDWLNYYYIDFEELKKNYLNFLSKRFEKQKRMILNNLFANENYTNPTEKVVKRIIKEKTSSIQRTVRNLRIDTSEIDLLVPLFSLDQIDVEHLSGWQKAIFNIIDRFEEDEFTLQQMYDHIDELKMIYPKNHSIDSKIRQVLQNLRDLKLIQFKSDGIYKRLWKLSNKINN